MSYKVHIERVICLGSILNDLSFVLNSVNLIAVYLQYEIRHCISDCYHHKIWVRFGKVDTVLLKAEGALLNNLWYKDLPVQYLPCLCTFCTTPAACYIFPHHSFISLIISSDMRKQSLASTRWLSLHRDTLHGKAV